VYFFKKTEIEDLITSSPRSSGETSKGPMFEIEQSDEDRRMVSHYSTFGWKWKYVLMNSL
jgi:hypothetical protein